MGGGESGVGAAVLAKVKGFDVFLSDNGTIADHFVDDLRKWDIPFEQGGHTEGLILSADEVVKSPGIPSTVPMVRKLEAQGTPILSEIEFAGRYDSAKKICITGSNGKTTTTSLIYYLLKNAGLNVGLGGNIGKSYAFQVATEHYDYYVLEISSFQLDNCYEFHPDIAIITNISPDHLDRYDYQLENYVKSKFRITQNLNPEDCFIFDSDDSITIDHLNKIIISAKKLPFTQKETDLKQGAFIKDDKIVVRVDDEECDVYLKELALGGKHNIYNSMAAALAAKASGIDNKIIRNSLETFQRNVRRPGPVTSVITQLVPLSEIAPLWAMSSPSMATPVQGTSPPVRHTSDSVPASAAPRSADHTAYRSVSSSNVTDSPPLYATPPLGLSDHPASV